ncbi:MAG TPA: amidase [Candidatus Dormibacteraeota bacterium]|nr:amidase [Candidatus Dormibacteraeota bacterium]
MKGPEELHLLTVALAGRRIRDGSLTPTSYVEALIERVRRLDPRLRCTITLAAENALAAAQVAESEIGRGVWRGPLHGIPIGIKDCIATAGLRTTANSRVLADWVPADDAPAVAALRGAGAIVFAKLNLNEFAWSIPSEDDLHPPPRNPWSPDHFAMGSSSGSAVAVASGLCPAALGTDAGGSIRQPAANCGVVGLKPTHRLVDASGAFGARTICEVGPITRSVEDAALLLGALVGGRRSYVESLQRPPVRARVGVPSRHIDVAQPDPQISAAFAEALQVLRQLGMEIVEVEIEGLADAAAADFVVLNAEAFAAHEETLRTRMEEYGRSARLYHTQGAFLSAADYIAALRVGETVRDRVDDTLSAVDVLATPVVPVLTAEAARTAKAQPHTGGGAIFTAPFNLTGHPALAVPCGMSADRIPIGLQLVGHAGGEADLLGLAHAYEQATPWHTMHPT